MRVALNQGTLALIIMGCLALPAGCGTTSSGEAAVGPTSARAGEKPAPQTAVDPTSTRAGEKPAPQTADRPVTKVDGDALSPLWDLPTFDPQQLRSLSPAGRVKPINRPTYHLALRLYLPTADCLAGKCRVPGIQRLPAR